MKKITRWSPDTCGCIIDLEWDAEAAQEDRTHTALSIVKACPAHAGKYPGKSEHFDGVLEENQIKNMVLSLIRERHPDLFAQDKKKFVRDFSYSFDEKRTLKFSHRQLDAEQKRALQSDLDTKIGGGKTKAE